MTKSLIKCNLYWIVFGLISIGLLGLTGLSTMRPDITKEKMIQNASDMVDAFNLRYKSETTPESYKKRDRAYDETSAFEEAQ